VPRTPKLCIEVRGPYIVAVDEDGNETVIGTYEHAVRVWLGEFGED
jgi:hypothetical protein